MLSDVVVVVAVLRQYVQQHTKAMAATRPTNRIMTNLISLFWGSIWFSLSPHFRLVLVRRRAGRS